MDNAATSFPKPPAVTDAMVQFANDLGASPGRGSYAESREASALLARCRQRISRLIGGHDPDHVIFTLNCSDALNMAIRGIVLATTGPRHLITTELDHNSVLRPFNELSRDPSITQTRLRCDPITGLVDPKDLRRAIRPETCLIAIAHASNVTGTLQRLDALGVIAREHGVPLLVDAAQSLGHVPIDVQAMNIDLLAAPGHKGLLGPLGTGFLYIRPGIERQMVTCREGGTGSISEQDTQPIFMPDRFEPGSHNTIGLVGLSEGVAWLLQRGMDDVHRYDQMLMQAFLEALHAAETPGLHLYGPPTAADRVSVFSIRIDGFDEPQALSDVLERDFGVLTRSGLHCAPGAHGAIGTLALGGTTRLSFGPFTTVEDVRYAAEAIAKVCQQVVAAG